MTFQLQPPAQIWDEEITTDKWPLPPAKPWAPKSSIDQMCEEALAYLALMLDADVMRHKVEMALPHVELIETCDGLRISIEFV